MLQGRKSFENMAL